MKKATQTKAGAVGVVDEVFGTLKGIYDKAGGDRQSLKTGWKTFPFQEKYFSDPEQNKIIKTVLQERVEKATKEMNAAKANVKEYEVSPDADLRLIRYFTERVGNSYLKSDADLVHQIESLRNATRALENIYARRKATNDINVTTFILHQVEELSAMIIEEEQGSDDGLYDWDNSPMVTPQLDSPRTASTRTATGSARKPSPTKFPRGNTADFISFGEQDDGSEMD